MLNVLAYIHLRRIVGSTGAGRVARCLTENLCKLGGLDVRVLGDRSDYLNFVPQAGSPWTELKHYLFEKDTSVQQARWLFFSNPSAEEYWSHVDVVFCPAESYVPVKKSRLVVTLHDAAHLEPSLRKMSLASLKQRIKWNYLYRVLEKKATAFHTVSQFSADRLSYYWPGIKDRVHVVHNGIADCFFRLPSQHAIESVRGLGLETREFVLFPSGLDHRKNADLVLTAWPRLLQKNPNLKLVITSRASDPIYVKRAGSLSDSIRFLGHVDDDCLNALYRSAAVVWFPSLYEGFGMPALEAMACGATVVASDNAAIPEVTGGAAILVHPAKPDDHVEALDTIYRNEALGGHYAALGVTRAQHFTWMNSALRMKTLLESVA
jgi:glycosyltransferase involved in cell wall biosynthesis